MLMRRRIGCVGASAPHPTARGREGVTKVLVRWFIGAQVRLAGLRERLVEERGATAVEYAIMLAFIAAVIVVAVAFLGQATNSQFEKVTFDPP